MEEMLQLKKQRGRVKAKLTNFSNFLVRIDEKPEKRAKLPSRLEKIEQLWLEFEIIQNKIDDIDESDEQELERVNFEDAYHELITRRLVGIGQSVVSQCASMTAQSAMQGEQFAIRPIVKLPNIDLPKFDGNYERWIPFRDLFDSLIASNNALPNVQKLHYLRSVLTGKAAKVISSLEITSDNYTLAWNLLKQRFENKRLIVQYLIQMLLDLPAIPKESHADLRQLVDNVSQYTQSLIKLGQPIENWSTIIIHIILPKIDKGSRREWESRRAAIEEFPTLTEFMEFIVNRSTFLEAVNRANQGSQNAAGGHARSNGKFNSSQHKNVTQAYVASNNLSCVICSSDHKLNECKRFLNMSVSDRALEVKGKRLCLKCLKAFHGRNCKAPSCKICKGYHNTLLHRPEPVVDEKTNKDNDQVAINNKQSHQHTVASSIESPPAVLNHCSIKGNPQVLLATAIIYICDRNGTSHECRTLLDSGSQSNFITKELSKRLNLKSESINTTIMGINHTPVNAVQRTCATIKSRVNPFQTEIPFLIINKITERLPMMEVDETEFDIPANLQLADPIYCTPGSIDVLLGASIFWEIMCSKQIRRSTHAPIFQKTLLGWIISGTMQTSNARQGNSTSYCGISINAILHQQLEKFWKIEEVEQSMHRSTEEVQCEEHFCSTHIRDEEGRFVLQLPLKGKVGELGDSYNIAEKRLKALERKLERQPALKEQYHEFLTEYLQLGHMTEIPGIEVHDRSAYYISHHAVTKEESTTTKVRVVFDASCKTSSGKSLNDLLMVGPIIQEGLFEIVIHLRQHKYAMAADITKMYRQIKVRKENRKLQRILWRWNQDEPIRVFELNTVTYGMSSSPFLAIRCLQEAAQQVAVDYRSASEVIKRDFYVDDLLTGADIVDALIHPRQQITHILAVAKFELRKWIANVPEICEQSIGKEKAVQLNDSTKVLGLLWNITNDNLQYKVKVKNDKSRITKRNILASVAQIYDPLGLLGPIIIQVKIILQRLWRLETGWEEVTNEIKNMWLQWRSEISSVEQLVIPRRFLCNKPERIELHEFCDASEATYGACIYIRSITSQKEYTVRLICAKLRVAPIKTLSLPRLELCGAVLLAKLGTIVLRTVTVQIHQVYYWCNSTIVLSWIADEAKRWKTFVANRVAEIQGEMKDAHWYHVRSEENPADLLTRGVGPEKLKDQRIWWEGFYMEGFP